MPFVLSPLIFTSSSLGILTNHCIHLDHSGKIIDIFSQSHLPSTTNEKIISLSDPIMPGMINTHCHMELSHMKGRIPTGTRLVGFIKQIITKRTADTDIIKKAVADAENEMYQNGIMAVGDISNVPDSFDIKHHGKLYYHTFIEAFDLMQSKNTVSEYDRVKSVYDQLKSSPRNKKSIVPHAPYSVSNELFSMLKQYRDLSTSTSIHHQETEAENEFVSKRTGDLVDFFQSFGLSLDEYIPRGDLASVRVLQHMSADQKTLLVHNTMSTPEDIAAINQWNDQAYWVTCPNANLYIENRLPDYKSWVDAKSKICIGTDSLASNWQLCVLEEMKTIQKYNSIISTEELIKWGTINGAEALGFDKWIGSLEPGKIPGIVVLENYNYSSDAIQSVTSSRRLVL
jgi:aminodeoxyfutalosine deaminase